MSIYDSAKGYLDNFINHKIKTYDKKRNYDYGPGSHDNVSNLSKFISHRVLLEYDVITQSLKRFRYYEIEKFIQEVFWRVYWKGWLEHRPKVWDDYINYDISNQDEPIYHDAISANTDIECFNSWVNELVETNYLHNHARMWFASIWIFTLKLPWQAGANFFLKHLFDGDAASNTLSWRWVAGLQTIGKHYEATSDNIYKFTNNRFKPHNLAKDSVPLSEDKTYDIKELGYKTSIKKSDSLVIFDNNLQIGDYSNYKNIYLVLLNEKERKASLSDKVYAFKRMLISEFAGIYPQSKIISGNDLTNLLTTEEITDIVYPCVGDNLTFLNNIADTKATKNFLYLDKDLYCWRYAKKGFFNFKKNIPSIIKKFNGTQDMFL